MPALQLILLTLVNICHGRSFNKGISNHWLEIQKINSSILYLIVVYQSPRILFLSSANVRRLESFFMTIKQEISSFSNLDLRKAIFFFIVASE